MLLKIQIFILVFISVAALKGDESATEEFFKQLLHQAGVAKISAQNICRELPAKNKALMGQMENVYQKAYENKNIATQVFAETNYLLGFLQERIEEACGKIMLADIDAIRTILMKEMSVLLKAGSKADSFESFIGSILGTEYSKFLYLTAAVISLEEMHTVWGKTMSSERKNFIELVNNIDAANKKLRKDVTEYTKSYKIYFEGALGPLDKKDKE